MVVLVVLSPAKALDYESPLPTKRSSEPRLLDDADELVSTLVHKTPSDLAKLMSISDGLAELNFERFQSWERPFTSPEARPAVLAFNGDVYQGMDAARTFSGKDFTRAQKTVRILSGLYGVLRPLDLMLPYRLEMGTKLKTERGRSLYEFWGSTIAEALNVDMKKSPGQSVVINLASNEYFKSVDQSALTAPVVSPGFLDAKGSGGDYRTVSFFAKRARGAMAAWVVRHGIDSVDDLASFDGLGYSFSSERSTDAHPVFTRRNQA